MKKTFGIIVVIAMLALLSVTSLAQTLSGTTGLINVPTAEVLKEGNTVVSYYLHRGHHYIAFALGVVPGVEVGIGSRFGNSSVFTGSVKAKLLDETETVPAVALGIETRGSNPSFYGVASKQLGIAGFRGHFAFGTGRFQKSAFGISKVLNPVQISSGTQRIAMPTLTLLAEYDGDGPQIGIQAQFSPEFSGQVYVSDFADFGAGLRYKF